MIILGFERGGWPTDCARAEIVHRDVDPSTEKNTQGAVQCHPLSSLDSRIRQVRCNPLAQPLGVDDVLAWVESILFD